MKTSLAKQPRVSVILPVYNPKHDLATSLASVLEQTLEDYEVIIVDDASTETTWNNDPLLLDPRIRILRQPYNYGVARARNRGVREARATLIAFLDQDDSWESTKLQQQVSGMMHDREVELCSTGFFWHMADGSTKRAPGKPITYEQLLSTEMIHFSSIMVRRATYLDVGGCDPTLTWAQDHDVMLKILNGGGKHIALKECLTHYFLHESNRSRNYRGSVGFRRLVIRKHELRAWSKSRGRTIAAAHQGYKRAWTLYSAQAFDAARQAKRSGEHGEMIQELVRKSVGDARRRVSSVFK